MSSDESACSSCRRARSRSTLSIRWRRSPWAAWAMTRERSPGGIVQGAREDEGDPTVSLIHILYADENVHLGCLSRGLCRTSPRHRRRSETASGTDPNHPPKTAFSVLCGPKGPEGYEDAINAKPAELHRLDRPESPVNRP
jgi:hypothetical protein